MNDLTVGDLIAMLEDFDPTAPVRLASQPSWPFEYTLDSEPVEVNGTVWLAEAGQVGYLPGSVSEALGWR
jgi:hypothetical protein